MYEPQQMRINNKHLKEYVFYMFLKQLHEQLYAIFFVILGVINPFCCFVNNKNAAPCFHSFHQNHSNITPRKCVYKHTTKTLKNNHQNCGTFISISFSSFSHYIRILLWILKHVRTYSFYEKFKLKLFTDRKDVFLCVKKRKTRKQMQKKRKVIKVILRQIA